MNDSLKGLGQRVKTYRRSLKITQSDVAKAIGHGTKYYQSMENGRRNFSLEALVKICELFNITLNDLIVVNQDTIDANVIDSCKENIVKQLDHLTAKQLMDLSIALSALSE